MTQEDRIEDSYSIRGIHPGDEEVIRSAISMTVKAGTKEWLRLIDLKRGTDRIIKGEVPAFIVSETYLLVAAPAVPWYGADDTRVLAEHMVLKVYNGPGKFQDVIQAMHGLARHWNCRGICVGTALAPVNDALARMYQRHGFTKQAYELFKEI